MLSRTVCIVAAAAALAAVAPATAINNGLGLTPQMGYNTWNDFRCSGINAKNIMAVADHMKELGMSTIGYEYVNIDDCWSTGRTADGTLVANATAFPDGIKAVATYVNAAGFKFGIYGDRGTKTCAGRPGSQGYETKDAQFYADSGVSYLKEDSCSAPQDHPTAFAQYGKMRDALNATGRPIFFSLCGWNNWYAPVGKTLGNSWRISGDCNAWPSIYNAIRVNQPLFNYSGPGAWNDPDMLVGSAVSAAVHNTPDQARTQFSLWSVMAAPLLIGSDILSLTKDSFDYATYSNAEVIAVDQDPLGYQGRTFYDTCPHYSAERAAAALDSNGASATVDNCQQVWGKKLSDGSWALNFVNFDSNPATVTCGEGCLAGMGITGSFKLRDLWAHKDLGTFSGKYTASLGGNGVSVTLKLTPA